MELFFNEISARYEAESVNEAKQRMTDFLSLCKKAKEEGFNRCRIHEDYMSLILTDNYTISSWLSDASIMKNLKTIFLSYMCQPFETSTEEEENRYIKAHYLLNEPLEETYHNSEVEGLAWAFICQSLSVSFPVHSVWGKPEIGLTEVKEDNTKQVEVKHVSKPDHFKILKDWIESLKKPEPPETALSPDMKPIHLGDHHGKEKLSAVAKKLINCPYVIGIPGSLPYNSHGRSFIEKVHPNGRIDVTLIEEDNGPSMMVETTGRTLRETEAIAEIIKDLY